MDKNERKRLETELKMLHARADKIKRMSEILTLAINFQSLKSGKRKELFNTAAELQPAFQKLVRRQPTFGPNYPEPDEILIRMAVRTITHHPEIYKSMLSRETEKDIFVGEQWDNACHYNIPLALIHPETMRLILGCKAPFDTPMWQPESTPKFPTRYYIVPNRTFSHKGQQVLFLGVSLITPDEYRAEEQRRNSRIEKFEGTETYHAKSKFGDEGVMYVSAVTDGIYGTETFNYREIQDGRILPRDTPMEPTIETTFQHQLLSIGLQLLLLENTYPEWHLPEKQETTHGGKSNLNRSFRPQVIGGNFPHRHQTNKKTGEETAAGRKRACEHWRGAHWRGVLYGKGKLLRRQQLILPCVVNFGEE